MGMGKHRATDALGYLTKLFPRWKTTDDLNELWVALFADYSVEAVTAVIKQHRTERGGNDPNLRDVRLALLAVKRQEEARDRLRPAPDATASAPPVGLSWAHTAQWLLDNRPEAPAHHRAEWELIASGQEPQGTFLRRIVRGMSGASVVRAIAGPVDPERERQRARNIDKRGGDVFEQMRGAE